MAGDTAGHDPCVLTPLCGPHCGLDRGYLGHCELCHSCEPTGRYGHHDLTASWVDRAWDMLGERAILGQMPPLSPRPG